MERQVCLADGSCSGSFFLNAVSIVTEWHHTDAVATVHILLLLQSLWRASPGHAVVNSTQC